MYYLTDIHFHTNLSFDAYENKKDYLDFDLDKLISNEKKLPDEERIKVIVKTDHNIFGYEKFKEMKSKLEKEGIVLLPGIELNDEDKFHWIFVFDDKSLSKKIDGNEKGILLDINIQNYFNYTKMIPEVSEMEKAQTNKYPIEKFISILNQLNISFLAIPHLNKSNGLYKVLKKNKDKLNLINSYLSENIINGFESKNYDDFFAENIRQTQNNILKLYESLSDINNEEELEDVSKMIENRVEHLDFMKEFSSMIHEQNVSSIYGSDFHGSKVGMDYYKDLKKMLFYMKSEPTFEGLRFALLDQFSRIYNFERYKKYKKDSSHYIKSLRFNINGEDKRIELGDGLNSIIGSRGSGKSFIIKKITNKDNDYQNSEIFSQIKLVEIKMANGECYSFLDENKYDYLSQKGNGNDNKNNNSIYELLAEAPYNVELFKRSILKFEHSKVLENNEIDEFFDLLNTQLSIFYNIHHSVLNDFDFSFVQGYIDFSKSQSETLLVKEKFQNLNNFLNRVINSKTHSTNLIKKSKETGADFLSQIQHIMSINEYKKLNEENNAYDLTPLVHLLNQYLDHTVNVISDKVELNKSVIEKVNGRCKNIINQINKSLTNQEQIYSEKFNELSGLISSVVENLRKAKQNSNKIHDLLEKEIEDVEILRFNVNNMNYYIKTKKVLKMKSLSDMQVGQMFYNYVSTATYQDFFDLFSTTYGESFNILAKKLDNRKKSYLLNVPELDDEIYIKPENENDYLDLKKMSPGQKSSLLLNMILQSNTDKILILDQPEDDLDNETIYKTIREKLRDLKLRRQIIIITHNANLCINGDSDYIITCENKNGIFNIESDKMESSKLHNYTSINSSLENKKQIDIAVNVLEGGKDAIRRRVKTIGYKDLFFKERG